MSGSETPQKKKDTEKSRKRKSNLAEEEEVEQNQQWSLDEKQRFVTALCKGPPYRHENGSINWMQLKKFIGSKTLKEVKIFAKKFHAMEHGATYPEFSTKAAIDVWRQLAEKTKAENDNISDTCIPQVLTVSALEPINLRDKNRTDTAAGSSSTDGQKSFPDYKNIYNYLSAITRGVDPPTLSPVESAVVLDLLEDLILTLSKSQTLIQREYLHSNYNELRKHLDLPTTSEDGPTSSPKKKFSSTNPFGIPFEILNFKLLEQCAEQKDTSIAKTPSNQSVIKSSEAPSKPVSQPKVVYFVPTTPLNPNSESVKNNSNVASPIKTPSQLPSKSKPAENLLETTPTSSETSESQINK